MGEKTYTDRVCRARVPYTFRLFATRTAAAKFLFVDAKEEMAVYKKAVGKRLKEARVASGIGSQADVAKKLTELTGETVEPSRIGNYEQGSRLPDPLMLKILCNLYGTWPSTIYGFAEAPASKDESVLLEKYRHTDDRGRRAIQGIADTQPGYEVDRSRKAG